MILGLVLGSGIKVLLPSRWMSATLGQLGLKSVMLGGLFALPFMMCTCCAAPVAAGMRDARAENAEQEPVLSLEHGNSEAAVRGAND